MKCQKVKKESLVANRQQEIIKACEELYETMEYEEISIKEIAKSTSICRSNIYNYYQTKDEIFLDILEKDYLSWMEDIKDRMTGEEEPGRESYCRNIAATAALHPRLLKLMSVHYITIEKNCSLEKLTAFKYAIHPFQETMEEILRIYFPKAPREKIQNFLFLLLSLIQGLYSMTSLCEKQVRAMQEVDPDYQMPDFTTALYQALYILTSDLL
ncbi:MAG TPA: TetR family transcriptional regulator [Candidatus Blautia stercoripullorum]|uniref:TetR family transcriptional regulator n=1 Tax=Candidatus Blautia stercoripullorum TaxID=2838502 RepID=A0A9D2R6Z9_9FIRM|nr:TetR family transcriptional regulator [Candidatus Blautia stercoripullorum]